MISGIGRRSRFVILPLLFAAYTAAVLALADQMKNKPFAEKVGYIPTVNTMKVLAADHKELLGASLLLKVLFYYGGLVEKAENKLQIPADYPAMSRTIHAAIRLDPYNMDGYYFAQAILTWDARKPELANTFLEYGMRYRDWDWYLPFYAGFNYAFFLKDFANAAKQYRRAAELSGQGLFMNLAGRYMHESGRTDMAIAYLDAMAKGARQESVKKTLNVRKNAFLEVRRIEKAREGFTNNRGRLPESIDELVSSGFLDRPPKDPYGGKFTIGSDGRISSTSGFSFAGSAR